MKPKLALLALALAAAMGLASCGGDGDEPHTPPSEAVIEPADPAYAHRANTICRDALDQTRELGEAFSKSNINAAMPDLVAVTTLKLVKPGIAIRRRMAARLRRLPPPARGGAGVDAYLDLFDPIDVLSRQRLRAGLARDLDEVRGTEALIQELGEEQQRAARLAGLETCAISFLDEAFGEPSGSG